MSPTPGRAAKLSGMNVELSCGRHVLPLDKQHFWLWQSAPKLQAGRRHCNGGLQCMAGCCPLMAARPAQHVPAVVRRCALSQSNGRHRDALQRSTQPNQGADRPQALPQRLAGCSRSSRAPAHLQAALGGAQAHAVAVATDSVIVALGKLEDRGEVQGLEGKGSGVIRGRVSVRW